MLKRIVKSVLATSLGWQAAALFRTGHVVVLMYHRINADDTDVTAFPGLAVSQFRGQMEWLKKNCTPVLPGEFLDAAKRTSRIKPPVVVTFDDGYRDYRERAYPILRELNIPAIVFLSTALVDRGGLIWTEAVHHATMSTNVSFIDLPWLSQVRIALSNHEEKVAFILHCKAYLKGVRNDVRLQHLDDLFQRARDTRWY
jgi:peptidoglycan/xylan/chitin deacetylase (PgdA/CDA1 family)